MDIVYYTQLKTVDVEKLLDIFEEIDSAATGETYNTSTAESSREMFSLDEDTSDRDALLKYFEELCDELIIAKKDEDIVGFAFLLIEDEDYKGWFPEHSPNVGVSFAGVLPEYWGEGIAKSIVEGVERRFRDSNIDYIVAGTSEENETTIKAMESLGMEQVGDLEELEYEPRTMLYGKEIE